MTTAVSGSATQETLLLAVQQLSQAAQRTTQAALLIAYAPPSAKLMLAADAALLIASSGEGKMALDTTQVAMLIAYTTGTPGQSRSRAWSFVLDGHTFYVLNLGQEGTFVYDIVTQQWSKFDTQGYGQWNMLNGCMWGNRIIGCDSITDYVWEMSPTAVLDDGWRDIQHIVTGGISTRSRVSVGCAAVRVSASVGIIDEVNGASFVLTYSDDFGATWSDQFTVALTSGDYGGEVAWRSLGSFAAPGRIFQLTDIGGLVRIDGCDAFLNGFDNDQQTQE